MIISKYIDFLDLTDLENRYLDELSGGQRQRTYVAMVLCQETEYVLLDEPLNNLDVARSVQIVCSSNCLFSVLAFKIICVSLHTLYYNKGIQFQQQLLMVFQ